MHVIDQFIVSSSIRACSGERELYSICAGLPRLSKPLCWGNNDVEWRVLYYHLEHVRVPQSS